MWNEKKRTEKKHKTSHFWHLKKKKLLAFLNQIYFQRILCFMWKNKESNASEARGFMLNAEDIYLGGKGGNIRTLLLVEAF